MKQVIIAESVLQEIRKSPTLFGRGGITVFPAAGNEEIVTLHRTKKVDIIIADFTSPGMDGVTLCKRIREDADLRDVSLIIVCDRVKPSADLSRTAGANAVIVRPLDSVELFSRMSELLVIPQRQNVRAFLRVSVVGSAETPDFHGLSHNISISGMLLETEQELANGDRLTCSFNLGQREIISEVLVVRANRIGPKKVLYGVKFLNLDTKSLIIIEQFVKGKVKQ